MDVAAIDIDRVIDRLDDLWEIGRTERGGVTRLAYSDEETAAIEYLIASLPSAYDVEVDSIGNVFATRYPDADRSIYLGSHLDSVYNGGRYDGTLGVLVALEALEAVHEIDAAPPIPPTLAIFRAEESARFGQHTIGSRGALGMLTVEEFAATDEANTPLWHAMQQQGFRPDNLSTPTIDFDRVAGFLEVHIEQGRVLDDASETLGIVTSIRAPVRFRVSVTGRYDHSGATPMELRKDALVAAAEMVTAIESIGTDAADSGDLVATVGDLTAVDGAINKVCGEVSFPVDVRSNDTTHRDRAEGRIRDRIDEIAKERSVTVSTELLGRSDPVSLDEDLVSHLTEAVASTTSAYRSLPSGGGHDAMNFQLNGIPTGMVFTPCVDGVSHNPEEETPPGAIRDAVEALVRAILTLEP